LVFVPFVVGLEEMVNWNVVKAASLIFGGCCSNVITLELLVKRDAGAGDVVTLAQFLFISIIGLLGQIRFSKNNNGFLGFSYRHREISIGFYAAYVAIFFTVSVLNNKALDYNIAMPFHMIFRSGSLVTSLILGMLILHKRYTIPQVLAVLAVTAGILLATTASVNSFAELAIGDDVTVFATGVTMLTIALILSSLLGILQEYTYSQYPDVPRRELTKEHQFYSHAFSLPMFLMMLPQILNHLKQWSTLALVTIPGLNIQISAMYLYLLGNVITQYVCISGVFMMTGAAGSLAMTLTISLRKFVSLVLSIVFFRNPFTPRHWIATVLVFGGTLVYSLWPRPAPKEPELKPKTN